MNKSFILTVLTSSFLMAPQFAVAGGSDPFEDHVANAKSVRGVHQRSDDKFEVNKSRFMEKLKCVTLNAFKQNDPRQEYSRQAWRQFVSHFNRIPHTHFRTLEISKDGDFLLGLKPETSECLLVSEHSDTIKILLARRTIALPDIDKTTRSLRHITPEAILGRLLAYGVFKDPMSETNRCEEPVANANVQNEPIEKSTTESKLRSAGAQPDLLHFKDNGSRNIVEVFGALVAKTKNRIDALKMFFHFIRLKLRFDIKNPDVVAEKAIEEFKLKPAHFDEFYMLGWAESAFSGRLNAFGRSVDTLGFDAKRYMKEVLEKRRSMK